MAHECFQAFRCLPSFGPTNETPGYVIQFHNSHGMFSSLSPLFFYNCRSHLPASLNYSLPQSSPSLDISRAPCTFHVLVSLEHPAQNYCSSEPILSQLGLPWGQCYISKGCPASLSLFLSLTFLFIFSNPTASKELLYCLLTDFISPGVQPCQLHRFWISLIVAMLLSHGVITSIPHFTQDTSFPSENP